MSNNDKINALVIDDKALLGKPDSQGRIRPMKDFLEKKFNLFFLHTLEDVPFISRRIHSEKIKVIFIDMYLVDGNREANQVKFLACLDYINKNVGAYFPIVIYSKNFSETLGWYYDIYEKKCAIIDSFGLDEQGTSTYGAERIHERVNAYYTQSIPQTNQNEIKILLLADLQISDPDTNISAKFQIVDRMVDALSRQEEIGNIDLIVILGDITYSGEPYQFNLAEKWIENLWEKLNFRNIYHSDYKKRLLIIPGNHDVNISLTALQNHFFRDEWKIRDSSSNEYLEYGLKPFCDFAFKMTGDENWNKFKENKLNFINDNFKYLGIRFIHLNSVHELNHTQKSYISFNTNLLDQMSEKLIRDESDIFKIFLSHNGFDDSNEIIVNEQGLEVNIFHTKRVPKAKWDENMVALSSWLYRMKDGYKLWLKGHAHIPSYWLPYKYDESFVIPNTKLRVVGTPTLGVKALPSKAVNSFDVLKLKRENDKIKSFRLFAFKEDEGEFVLRSNHTDKSENIVSPV